MRLVTASGIALLSLMLVQTASAQEPAPDMRAAFDSMEVVTGLMDFDLSGVGQTMPFGIRVSKALTDHLALEIGTTFARPRQQFGGSSMTIPEAQLSYAWRLGRVRPFASGGAGVGLFESNNVPINWWRPTFSAGGGARIDVSDRVYAVGEMRLRGLSRRFSSSTAEWVGGIGWRFR